jgi:hypothetical protein
MSMDKRTREALEGSIQKWQNIAAGVGVDKAHVNCPLCLEFRLFDGRVKCLGCPVAKRTGLNACCGTPYESWTDHQEAEHVSCVEAHVHYGCDACYDLAVAELDFLESLREEVNA